MKETNTQRVDRVMKEAEGLHHKVLDMLIPSDNFGIDVYQESVEKTVALADMLLQQIGNMSSFPGLKKKERRAFAKYIDGAFPSLMETLILAKATNGKEMK